MNNKVLAVAQQRLKSLPNAIAQGPCLGSRAPIDKHGLISFRDQFDIVVSYMGALNDGSTSAKKISQQDATDCAVRACRQGGSVVVAEIKSIREILKSLLLPVMVTMRLLAYKYKFDPLLVLLLCSIALCGVIDGPFVCFVSRNIVTSITMKKWRLRTWKPSWTG